MGFWILRIPHWFSVSPTPRGRDLRANREYGAEANWWGVRAGVIGGTITKYMDLKVWRTGAFGLGEGDRVCL